MNHKPDRIRWFKSFSLLLEAEFPFVGPICTEDPYIRNLSIWMKRFWSRSHAMKISESFHSKSSCNWAIIVEKLPNTSKGNEGKASTLSSKTNIWEVKRVWDWRWATGASWVGTGVARHCRKFTWKGNWIKTFGNEVHYTACSLLVVFNNLCSKLHYQKVLI